MRIPKPINGTIYLENYVSEFHDLDVPQDFFEGLVKEKKYILFRNVSQRARNILRSNFSSFAHNIAIIIKDLPSDFFQN